MLNVHHFYPVGSGNVGDRLVATALRRQLAKHLGPCRFVDVPANDRFGASCFGLQGAALEAANREADFILVGGSNLLEARKPRRNDAGVRVGRWGIATDVGSLAKLERPLVSIGMGSGSEFRQRVRPYREPTIGELNAFAAKAQVFAVRDEMTRTALKRIGVAAECTGCPVTFWTDRVVQNADPNAPLIVSFPSTGLADHAPGRRFLSATTKYLEWLDRIGEPCVVALHDERDFDGAQSWIPAGLPIFASTDVDRIVERYENCRGVVGFRLHAALLALGLGKPIVPVGLDWRGHGFIETFRLNAIAARVDGWFPFAKLRYWTLQLLAGSEALVQPLRAGKLEFADRFEATLRRTNSILKSEKLAA